MFARWISQGSEFEDLAPEERARFFVYIRNRLRRNRLLLMFAMPLLFLAGWLPDTLVRGGAIWQSLYLRLGLVSLLVASAMLLLTRSLRRWQEPLSVLYLLVFGAGIAVTTLRDPARMSLIHVVIALMLIIWMRFAIRPATVIATLLALCAPLVVVMTRLNVGAETWAAYGAFCLVGALIGLASRRTHMEAWLEIYRLRGRLLERLHEDALTGIGNRDAWQVDAVRQHARTMQEGESVCVVFFDLDRFKNINDRYGHATGDAVLQQVANLMARNLRSGELLARVGGEEFVALLPRTSLADATSAAERIRQQVAGIQTPVPITVSAGVACGRTGESLDALTARADRAMLEAKRNGRNRVELAREPGDAAQTEMQHPPLETRLDNRPGV